MATSIRKPSIPQVPRVPDAARVRFDQALKERLETLAGERGAPIAQLTESASQADIIAKINEIIALLQ